MFLEKHLNTPSTTFLRYEVVYTAVYSDKDPLEYCHT